RCWGRRDRAPWPHPGHGARERHAMSLPGGSHTRARGRPPGAQETRLAPFAHDVQGSTVCATFGVTFSTGWFVVLMAALASCAARDVPAADHGEFAATRDQPWVVRPYSGTKHSWTLAAAGSTASRGRVKALQPYRPTSVTNRGLRRS